MEIKEEDKRLSLKFGEIQRIAKGDADLERALHHMYLRGRRDVFVELANAMLREMKKL